MNDDLLKIFGFIGVVVTVISFMRQARRLFNAVLDRVSAPSDYNERIMQAHDRIDKVITTVDSRITGLNARIDAVDSFIGKPHE